MPPHPLRNFEIQNYYQNEPKFNGAYSRNSLPKIKDGAYVINLDEYKSVETHWIALCGNANNILYLNSFGVEHIPKEIKKFIKNKNIITNIYRIQAYDYGYFCIGFINFMLKCKSLLEYTNLFSPNDYEKNDKMILFSVTKKMTKLYCIICGKYREFEKPKVYLLEKTLVLSIFCSKCKNEDEKLFKEEESIEILKILGLNENI